MFCMKFPIYNVPGKRDSVSKEVFLFIVEFSGCGQMLVFTIDVRRILKVSACGL